MINKLKKVKIKDILGIFIFIIVLIPSLVYKTYLKITKKEVWLICELKDMCRDNGYHFFKYMSEEHPEIKTFYAINKKCPDYNKIIKYDSKIIQWESLKHYFYYMSATKNISTHKEGNPNQALFTVLHLYLNLYNNRVFLQHGITKDNVPMFYYKNTKFKKFICGAKREFEYIKDVDMPKEQKALDLINVVSLLHNKTTYYKVVSDDVFKSIYDSIKSNIDFLKNYYENMFNTIENIEYMSPSEYLLIRNSSKIFSCLSFCEKELDEWFDLTKEDNKQRVSLIHNNLALDHFIKNDKDYLISWDKSKIDSPVLDLINFYKNNYFDLDFETILNSYQSKYKLNESEKKLLFIVISLPLKYERKNNEFNSCTEVRNILDYLFKTEELVRPYYTVNQED